MKRVCIKEIYRDMAAFDGKTITVAGWARNIRASNAFGFIELNDYGTLYELRRGTC